MTDKKTAAPPAGRAISRQAGQKNGKTPRPAPQKLELLFTVVERSKAEFYLDLIQSYAVNLQLAGVAHGTAGSELLALMGLHSGEKRVLFSIVRDDAVPQVLSALEEKFRTIKNGKGVAWTVPLTGVIGVSVYRFLTDNRRGMEVEK